MKNFWCSFFGVGYMLEFFFSNMVVMYGGNLSILGFDEFIIEIWICLVNKGLSVFEFCLLSQRFFSDKIIGIYVIFFVLINSGNFVIFCKNGICVDWDGEKFVSGINIIEGMWIYFVVMWRNIDG